MHNAATNMALHFLVGEVGYSRMNTVGEMPPLGRHQWSLSSAPTNLQPPASREYESDGRGFYYAVDVICFNDPTHNNLWFRAGLHF